MPHPFIAAPRVSAREAIDEPDARWESFGALKSFLDDDVTDVFVNGEAGLFLDRGTGAEHVAQWRASEREVRDLAIALVAQGGRHLDDASPCVDVRLPGGVRVHAVLPPVAVRGTSVSIRVPRLHAPDLDDLRTQGTFSAEVRDRLILAVQQRRNILITGATGSGKTTLLGALLAHTPTRERIVTIEDVAELHIRHPHHIPLEARQTSVEGVGGIDLSRLVRESLRMRPDRIVVGECRGPEVRDLLTALNTGHDGGAGTLHANSLADVPTRLEALGALAGMDARAVARQVVSAIGLLLHVERDPSGVRRLSRAGRFVSDGDRWRVEEVEPCHI